MNNKLKTILTFAIVLAIIFSFSACLGNTPKNYTEGINYNRDFPDDVLELYDDIIVFKEDTAFGEMVLNAGSESDIDDIRDFYIDFMTDNGVEPIEESDKRKQYSVSFVLDSYLIRIEIGNPSGEYEEELYKSVITYGAKKLSKEEALKLAATPTPTPAPTPEPTPEVPVSNKQLAVDSYVSTWLYEEGMHYGEITFTILDDTQGIMYRFDPITFEIVKKEFEYLFIDDDITFKYSDGTISEFYLDNYDGEDYILIDKNTPYTSYCFTIYSSYKQDYSENDFTCGGCWYSYDTDENTYSVLSLWDNGIYLLYSSDDDNHFHNKYEYSDGTLTLFADSENLNYIPVHYGDILELHNEDGLLEKTFIRVNERLLEGSYELFYSSNEKFNKFDVTIGYEHICSVNMQSSIMNLDTDEGFWFISRSGGSLVLSNKGEDLEFLTPYRLHLEGEYIYLSEVLGESLFILSKVN